MSHAAMAIDLGRSWTPELLPRGFLVVEAEAEDKDKDKNSVVSTS